MSYSWYSVTCIKFSIWVRFDWMSELTRNYVTRKAGKNHVTWLNIPIPILGISIGWKKLPPTGQGLLRKSTNWSISNSVTMTLLLRDKGEKYLCGLVNNLELKNWNSSALHGTTALAECMSQTIFQTKGHMFDPTVGTLWTQMLVGLDALGLLPT